MLVARSVEDVSLIGPFVCIYLPLKSSVGTRPIAHKRFCIRGAHEQYWTQYLRKNINFFKNSSDSHSPVLLHDRLHSTQVLICGWFLWPERPLFTHSFISFTNTLHQIHTCFQDVIPSPFMMNGCRIFSLASRFDLVSRHLAFFFTVRFENVWRSWALVASQCLQQNYTLIASSSSRFYRPCCLTYWTWFADAGVQGRR